MTSLHLTITSMVLFFALGSCQSQDNPKPKKEDLKKIENFQFFQPKIDTNDIDPYFRESNNLTTKEGPRVITRNILQDKSGKFWFATWNGIVSYDGEKFTNHTNESGLRRHRAFSILEDQDGNIWFGTIGAGVYKYDGKTFQNITEKDGFGSVEVECMYEDDKGNIWFGTGDGVTVYDGKNFQNFTLQDGLLDTDVHSITQDGTGKIWIGSANGISIHDPKQGWKVGASFFALKDKKDKSYYNVRTIIEDRDGTMWFGGNDGLNTYRDGEFTNMSKDFVGYLYEDRAGNIWFNKPTRTASGDIGLYRHTRRSLPLAVSKDNIEEIRKVDEMIFGIMEDKEGNIWYGSVNGIAKYDGKIFHNFK